jgi:NADH:ubiquinone oxidoreductase subunit K
MFFGDINILFFFLYTLISTLLTHTNSALHLLLTAELIWITLYALLLVMGLTYDNLNLVALTFFFLLFSAVEFALGLVLLLLQHLILRTIQLDTAFNAPFKFTLALNTSPLMNGLPFKTS